MSRPSRAPRAPAVRRASTAWAPFAARLARTLAQLAEDQFLLISVAGSSRFVQFAAQGTSGLRAEVVANQFLPRPEQLDEHRVSRLRAMGWRVPTGRPDAATPDAATPRLDRDASPNFHIDCPPPVAFADIAETALRALTAVLDVPHPSRLRYEAFDTRGAALAFPALGLAHASSPEGPAVPPDPSTRLLAAVRKATGVHDLDFDADGDIPLRYGRLSTFVRYFDDPPRVRYLGVLLTDAEPGPGLLARLNEFNAAGGPARAFLQGETVFAAAEILAEPLVAAQVAQALHAFCAQCDGLMPRLEGLYGGRLVAGCDAPGPTLH